MTPGIRLRFAVSVLTLAACAACIDKSETDLMAAARSHMAKGEATAAALQLKSALQKSPQSAEARFLLGWALLDQGAYADSVVEFGKAQEAGYAEQVIAPKLAHAMVESGKPKEVLSRFSGMQVTPPTAQAELLAAVALARARLGDRAGAEQAIEEALKADPAQPWALLNKARLLALGGKTENALAMLERALTPTGPNGEVHMLIGTILRFAVRDVEGAAKAYAQAAADPAATLPARIALAQMRLSQHRLDDAKAELDLLAKVYPKHPQTKFMDAVIAYAAKDYERTESIVDQLMRFMPDSPQLLMLGGAAHLQRANLLAAETKLGKVAQTHDNVPVARKMLAETYLRMGQPEKALATLRPLLDANAPDGETLALAGQAQLQAGNPQQAEGLFAAALKAKPDDVQIRTTLALADLVKGKSESAFEALSALAAKDPGETADLALISAHLRRGEFDAALAATEGLARKLPTKATASHLRGLAFQGKGDWSAARAAFEAALKAEPRHFASMWALCTLDLQERHPEKAKTRLESFIQQVPTSTAARLAMLEVLSRMKAKPDELLATVQDAIKAAPGDPQARIAKVALLSRLGDTKGAAAAAQEALSAFPAHPEVLDAAGRALSNSGDHQQAISAFNKLATARPRSAVPYLRLADMYARRGDGSAVASNLARAFEAEPESAEVHRRLLSAALRTKDYKPVLAASRELQRRFPSSAMGYILEGDAEATRKAWPAAISAFRAALAKTDPVQRAPRLLHAALLSSGDRAGADRFVSDWLKSNPKDVKFRESLGAEALARKDYGAAERQFQDILAVQPNHAAAMNNLAWLMAERGRKGAVVMAERALAAAPGAPSVLDTLAKAQASEGDLTGAVETQKKAVAAAPDSTSYRLALARLYVQSGKKPEAEAELAAIRALPDGPAAAAAVKDVRALLSR